MAQAKETKPALPPAPVQPEKKPQIPAEVTGELDEIMRRLKLLEERYTSVRKKSQFSEQSMLKETKEVYEDINLVNSTLKDIKGQVSDLNEKLIKLTEEVDNCVSKSDFNVISKYLEFWQPLNFLTKEEAEKMLSEYKAQKGK
jgi:hypothetical protein